MNIYQCFFILHACTFKYKFNHSVKPAVIEGKTSPDYLWVTSYDLPNRLVCGSCYQSVVMSMCAVINCNNKKNTSEVSHLRLPRDTSVHKDWIHVMHRPVEICHPKSKIYENFWTAIPKNKHVYCQSFEFLHNILC